ncbi:hypothetical protein BN2476_210115 [Paraburkholderia piptadeniae]|uniref:Uncharacterized protein n=1 Tax=Paraburkholderia piptadeniae TaxID=1701573 RepID=A0A1N7RVZ4_9BURK|nr:hypothetical protein BN2476_210115 [Paraburkholderia piptadeniae]
MELCPFCSFMAVIVTKQLHLVSYADRLSIKQSPLSRTMHLVFGAQKSAMQGVRNEVRNHHLRRAKSFPRMQSCS